jgi:hypothetical protein
MAAYRAMIEGRNFLLAIDGKVRRYGFYQTVFLECADQLKWRPLRSASLRAMLS